MTQRIPFDPQTIYDCSSRRKYIGDFMKPTNILAHCDIATLYSFLSVLYGSISSLIDGTCKTNALSRACFSGGTILSPARTKEQPMPDILIGGQDRCYTWFLSIQSHSGASMHRILCWLWGILTASSISLFEAISFLQETICLSRTFVDHLLNFLLCSFDPFLCIGHLSAHVSHNRGGIFSPGCQPSKNV